MYKSRQALMATQSIIHFTKKSDSRSYKNQLLLGFLADLSFHLCKKTLISTNNYHINNNFVAFVIKNTNNSTFVLHV